MRKKSKFKKTPSPLNPNNPKKLSIAMFTHLKTTNTSETNANLHKVSDFLINAHVGISSNTKSITFITAFYFIHGNF